ncbi:unnamed protein product, partial [Ranitomeya imitator]
AALNLMDLDYAKRCGFFLEPLRCPIPLRGIDATPLAKNKPQYWAQLTMCMAPAHQEVIRFLYKTQYHTKVYKIPAPADQNITVPTELPTDAVNISDIVENVTRAMGRLQEMMEIEEVVPAAGSANGVNALGLVVFSMCFGLVIGNMKEQGRALKEFFDCLNEAIMRLVAIIIWYAPIGILFLISGKILEMDDLLVMGGQLGMYTITVIIGLLIHAFGCTSIVIFHCYSEEPLAIHWWVTTGSNHCIGNVIKVRNGNKIRHVRTIC